MDEFLNQYLKTLTDAYPSVMEFNDLQERFARVVSPLVISLPREIYTNAQACIRDIFNYAHSKENKENLIKILPAAQQEILLAPIKNYSTLMSYDFHYNPVDNSLYLIEINTNASAFLISDLLYKAGDFAGEWPDALHQLKLSFLEEFQLGGCGPSPRIAIMDEDILTQKMYPEFFMYRDLFKSWLYSSQICEVKDIQLDNFDFIYNRYNDFIFSSPNSRKLRAAYLNCTKVFSPNPQEYILLADKMRLVEFYKNNVSKNLLPTFALTSELDQDEIWSTRKDLLFKPKNLFGAKAVYRGDSISRKKFAELWDGSFLAQKFCPPGLYDGWKFDLRFYAYKSQIQLGIARVYKGQVTNFDTLGGGLARISI